MDKLDFLMVFPALLCIIYIWETVRLLSYPGKTLHLSLIVAARDKLQTLQSKAFFFFLRPWTGSEVYITNWTAPSSQAGALLSGESDPPKVNRLGPDCLRMCTVSQTAVSGSPGLINGSCGGSGEGEEMGGVAGGGRGVYSLKSWSLSAADLCIATLPLLGNAVSDH